MIMLTIPEVKPFMAKLLTQTTFDSLILRELELSTFTNFTISGYNEAFYSKEEQAEQSEKHNTFWSDVRAIVFAMIKGNKTPLMFKIILQLPINRCAALVEQSGGRLRLEDIGGLYLNIRFEKNELHIISGTAIKTFSLDKTLEQEWDAEVKRFLREQGILYEEQ